MEKGKAERPSPEAMRVAAATDIHNDNCTLHGLDSADAIASQLARIADALEALARVARAKEKENIPPTPL